MKRPPRLQDRTGRARHGAPGGRGFTLAEVAVAIVIVGMGLIWILEGLNVAKLTTAHTRNYKLARELALLTLGQIESGEYQEDIARGLTGSYGEEGYPEFSYEVIVGDETFSERKDDGSFDSWAPRDTSSSSSNKDGTDPDSTDPDQKKEQDDPFEKIKIKVVFPKIREFTNDLVLERWVPWNQVYGEKEQAAPDAQTPATGNGTTNPATGGATNGTSTGGSTSKGGAR